ncbi:hypothetical protein M409DRAFT_21238 [Zasmidium cellare ATCC 36951]|uniref:Structure-specific endonuclease subunit SLX4 n=1 Tax=Zasmidium cellare ATCC 36951 TaxID=1080233 RepID=A0A6A6CRT0_ZASCE|nr:uncharacterized protein M409DRAFT_21238 [Zasmidium cellare ATCC 36951]KAF2168489.1 hypothetical protein M409DRAFT_21238 [Zasmidium cellare ATCC 36951]
MASRSPIVVNSSSQASIRIPSVTPQSHRKKSNAALSSSPGLAELPTFARVPAKGLKSGSNAQQVPEGAALGFASAATLFKGAQSEAKLKEKEQHVVENGAVADVRYVGVSEKRSGRLSQPKKPKKTGKDRKNRSDGSSHPALKSIHDSQGLGEATGTGNTCPYFGQSKSRTPSISLSEFDFRPEEHQGSPLAMSIPPESLKKSKKSSTKTGKSELEGPSKKPPKRTAASDAAAAKTKKRFTKSESIILNSDEPDADTAGHVPMPATTPAKKSATNETSANDSRTTVYRLKSAEGPGAPRIGFHVEKDSKLNGVVAKAASAGKSMYFSEKIQPEVEGNRGNGQAAGVTPETLSADETSDALPTLVAAPRRRLSWTPAKNTTLGKPAPDGRPGTAPSAGSDIPPKSLTSLISGFEYSESTTNSISHDRTSTGEALTKRRRIELVDASTVATAKRKPAAAVPSEPRTKTKVKKKPQTITALATKAYHPDSEAADAQPTVSEFFDAQTSVAPPTDASVTHLQEHGKVTKPRKPRAKKVGDGTVEVGTKITRKVKSKAKSREKDPIVKLHSPGQARAQERSQGFMFGTSSQLALEESPSYLREIQAAIEESEPMPTSHTGNRLTNKSSIQVPSAPHGTNISVGQGNRGLWCSATRDEGGSFLDVDMTWERPCSNEFSGQATSVETLLVNTTDEGLAEDACMFEAGPTLQRDPTPPDFVVSNEPGPPLKVEDGSHNTMIDLGQTSSPNARGRAEPSVALHVQDTAGTMDALAPTAASSPPQHHFEDEWNFLSSDDSVPNAAHGGPELASTPPHPLSPVQPYKPPQLLRSATSPLLHRTALQNLDANIGLLSRTSPVKNIDSAQQRALKSTTADQTRRRRGRPRKPVAAAAVHVTAPKRRGRPPKAPSALESAAVASFETHGATMRPVKSASQPTGSKSWIDIDEISESDSPSTPSPPRQRAGSSPPTVQPLDLRTAASPSLRVKAPAVVSSTLKLNDSIFADIQADIFSRITATIRSTAPSTDMKNPTWHEKILLYDPIVLEDLTAWLNEQGLCIEMQRLKPKPKSRGRKKKDAVPDEPEYETVKEELKPWMVQKWCEDNSICCLWKEGLRGGVRTRY